MYPISRILSLSVLAASACMPAFSGSAESPDSVSFFSYASPDGKTGLRFAWSGNEEEWTSIGGEHAIDAVKSDFGPWGSHKKMFDPQLARTADGWRATWYVSDLRETLACADSPDLIKWKPQRYAVKADSLKFYGDKTVKGRPASAIVNGKERRGEIIRISRAELNALLENAARVKAAEKANAETFAGDVEYFNGYDPCVRATHSSVQPVKVSPELFGIFFEDISRAADGGLYAELVQNRDFEYLPSECGTQGWGPGYAWSLSGENGIMPLRFSDAAPIHPNNPTYLKIESGNKSAVLTNSGFDGISLKKGDLYDFSIFVRLSGKGSRKFNVAVTDKEGNCAASKDFKAKGEGWQKIEFSFKADRSVHGGELRITIPASTECDLDMISLFPADTYKGRRNGLRRDLAEALEALDPKFVRFPGGCVAHGDGIDNIYDWKGSIGPLEARRPLRNLWGYHQTRGLGYHEYFLLCEDLGATPLPVVAAGVPCQNSGRAWSGTSNELTRMGQQDGIPMNMMPAYIQDVLDLIEYANGPVDSKWGALRAMAGHPEPFNLKYIGIGNEDMITEVFEKRFTEIYNAVREAHPEIVVVGTVGPFYEGTDYDEGWRLARELKVPMVDEHYYVSPGWLINNRGYYDSYPRGGDATRVYLGEYASHAEGRKNNMETALSTALYLTDVERNSDVVAMTSYAPLFAKKGHMNWRPDLIYFDNDTLTLTTDYHVQKMFGNNQGDEYIPVSLTPSVTDDRDLRRFGYSAMCDSKTGSRILKLINALPVDLELTQEFIPAGSSISLTTLQGQPSDENAVPVTSASVASDKIILPPYSFVVIRTN